MTIEITIKGEKYGLTFGMNAIEAMQIRQLARMQAGDPTGNTQALTDMFYCAHNCFNDTQEPISLPRITYKNASDIIEDLVYSGDKKTEDLIVESFKECKATKHHQEVLEGVKKKVEETEATINQTT